MRDEFSLDQWSDAARQTVNDPNRITSRMHYLCTRRNRCEDLVSTTIGETNKFSVRVVVLMWQFLYFTVHLSTLLSLPQSYWILWEGYLFLFYCVIFHLFATVRKGFSWLRTTWKRHKKQSRVWTEAKEKGSLNLWYDLHWSRADRRWQLLCITR